MASNRKMWQFVCVILAYCAVTDANQKTKPVVLTEDTWVELLEGEWLVKFYAPWCPACKAMANTWEGVAGWSDDLGIKVADIDITENPGLSGRFLVTALPTIYHVKNGEFRMYRGSRDENDFISFVDDKKYLDVDPVSWYSHPNAVHMSALSMFFRLSVQIRDLHNKMTEEFGIPVWGSYTIFALATIAAGLILGLVVVCLCDVVYPPSYPAPQTPRQYSAVQHKAKQDEDDDDESDVVEDDRYDAVDNIAAGESDNKGARPKSAGVRKRPQKAD